MLLYSENLSCDMALAAYSTLDQVAIWLLIELRVKDLPLKRHQADERLDHASRKDGRPAQTRGSSKSR